jgi:hypothetical protein
LLRKYAPEHLPHANNIEIQSHKIREYWGKKLRLC